MAKEAPLYDLTLLLSTNAEDERREKVLSDVESAITTGGGSIERNDDWGRRPLSYEIRHQPEAAYHLLQFHAPGTLIEELSHTLRITDGVLRFRVIKVRPGTPPAPSSPPPVVAAVAQTGHGSAPASAAAPAAASAPRSGAEAGAASGTESGAGSGAESGAESGAADSAES